MVYVNDSRRVHVQGPVNYSGKAVNHHHHSFTCDTLETDKRIYARR